MQVDATHMLSLFENATEGIILTNSKGEIVLVNPAAQYMFGFKSEELIDQRIEVLIPPRFRENHENLRKEFYQAPQNRTMGHGRDLYARKKDGTDFPVEVSLSHYRRDKELFVIAFIIDITFRKEIEQNMIRQQKELEKVTNDVRKLNLELETKVEERTVILKEALMKLEQSQIELSDALDKEKQLNEIKSRFVSMASHEFRTPLSTVLSSASLLSKYTDSADQEKRDKHIHRIKESVRLLNDILEDFLNLGKLEEGKVAVNPGEFDLRDLIEDTTEEMLGLLKKDQHFTYEHKGTTGAFSDKKLLKNILINLIANAIKFSDEGLPIIINSEVQNGKAEISVTDRGIGIPPEDIEHLFSSFFRGRNATNIQGTGLGLPIVKRYLDLLGGEIHLQSKLNEGTKIIFNIPINHPA
jgi:PAS domain S-box-containing protein